MDFMKTIESVMIMAKATLKLNEPINELIFDIDENNLEVYGYINIEHPKNNYDKLRLKTIEEMAQWYARTISFCYGCKIDNERDCMKCILNWLKEEV